jgi:hypothetical protein
LRRSETVVGLIAGVLGFAGWLYALFGPTGSYVRVTSSTDGSSTTESGSTSMWRDEDLEAVTVVFLLVMLASIIGVIVGVILQGRSRAATGRAVLWTSAITLLAGSILSALSIGLFLLPGALLAVIAAVLTSVRTDRFRNLPEP